MDVFFSFIDKINKPIFVLYDKNFIHINKYLLGSLGFTSSNRPGSLTQIMESKWKNKLMSLRQDEQIDVPLIMNGGRIQTYRVRMHQLEIEKSEYICFILNVKEAQDQIIDIANRIFTKLPFPAFTFNNDFEFLQVNETLKNHKRLKLNSFEDLKKNFKIIDLPDFTNQELYSYQTINEDMEIFLFKPFSGLSYNYYTGIIIESTKYEKSIDVDYVKGSIAQSIQRLIHLQKIYGNQSNMTQSIWQGMHDEITSLSNIRRQLENDSTNPNSSNDDALNLNKIIINEIEILKSNDFFRQNVKLVTQFVDNISQLNLKHSDITGSVVSLVDQFAEFACLSEKNELYIETSVENDLIWLKVYMKIGGQSAKQKSEIFKNINKYKKQFIDADVLFVCNKDSKKNIDLSIGFSK